MARDPAIIAVTWVVVFLKIAGGVLALALVQPWGRRLPRRWLLHAAWGGTALLIGWGVLQETSVALVKFGVVTATEAQDPTVLAWRLLLWEPWFRATRGRTL